jgi:hypothetical protein
MGELMAFGVVGICLYYLLYRSLLVYGKREHFEPCFYF